MKPSSNPMASGSPTAQESSSPPPDERFLSRWSRLKRAQAQDAATTGGPVATDESALTSNVAAGATARPAANAGIPLLPSIDSLTADSDYAQFLQPKVPEALRRAAMKKLFSDPHFNKLDGLDTYIDDYTTFEPIGLKLSGALTFFLGAFYLQHHMTRIATRSQPGIRPR